MAESSGPFYRLVGDDVTLLGFNNIVGNPSPSSDWSTDDGAITNGGRFNTSIPGQLLISSLILSDSNNYTITLTNTVNGDDLSITNNIELMIAGQC